MIGITRDEQAELWDVLQALLLLGDAEFFDESEPDENDDLNTSTGHDEDEKVPACNFPLAKERAKQR